jgi:Flp pilus assembly protein TadB
MIIVPVMAFFGLMIVAPHYETILFTSSTGRMMLLVGTLLMVTGAFLLKRLVQSVET